MDKVIVTVTSGKATVSQGRHDDDFADRLSSRYTPLLLIVFTIVVTIQQLVRNPITCWTPVHFTKSHIKYSNSYCWIRNTYYLPYDNEIPREEEDKQMLTYYQWIQFILLAQAMFFFFPTLVWRTFNSKAGVDADNILQTSHKIPQVSNAEKKENIVRFLAGQIDRFLESRKPEQKGCQCDMKHFLSGLLCRCCGRRFGNYLVLLYVFQKILFIVNIILQFVALDAILGNRYYIYGAQWFMDPVSDHDWTAAPFVAFPRVTMCDVKVRRLGNLQRYTLQCVLPVNLYIEKMYVFLWFWMVFVLAATIFSFIMWSIRFLFRRDRYNFIKNHLTETHDVETPQEEVLMGEFLDDYLRQDGAFILRLIATNTNHVSTGVIISGLWDYWLEKTGNGTSTPPSEVEDKTDLDPLLHAAPQPARGNDVGLKYRGKKPISDKPDDDREKPKRDLSRAPTLYVRGSDTIGSRRPNSDLYPKVSEKDPNSKKDPDPASDDSDLDPKYPLPPGPPSINVTPSSSGGSEEDLKKPPEDDGSKPWKETALDDSFPVADTSGNLGSLYPDIAKSMPTPAPRVVPTAPPGASPTLATAEITDL